MAHEIFATEYHAKTFPKEGLTALRFLLRLTATNALINGKFCV